MEKYGCTCKCSGILCCAGCRLSTSEKPRKVRIRTIRPRNCPVRNAAIGLPPTLRKNRRAVSNLESHAFLWPSFLQAPPSSVNASAILVLDGGDQKDLSL